MAHKIYQKAIEGEVCCPRCNATEATISVYHSGTTYQAECSWCGYGRVTGDNEEMAIARLRGKMLEASNKTMHRTR